MSKVIVFDIDGTLADIRHRRHFVASKPKNWKAFERGIPYDDLHEDIAFLLEVFVSRRDTIILCSGRNESSRLATEVWLEKHNIRYQDLFMRTDGDYRQDSIVKVELLERIIALWGKPYLWFDDRTQVVDAIRAQGIRVLQVAPGDF